MSLFIPTITIRASLLRSLERLIESNATAILVGILSGISAVCFTFFLHNGLGLSYNDARSHLDIGRRVVEGLKPGLAQLGSVWLPLPHILMIPTIWDDFMWHTGLAGSIQSMVSFIITGLIIYRFLKLLGVGLLGRFLGVFIFVANINTLYLQSIAMTELLLVATMTAGVYELAKWAQNNKVVNLIKASFFVMLSTLVRYDGWFLFLLAIGLVGLIAWKRAGYKVAEGTVVIFSTLGGIGILFWFLWNLLIFKDPLYFAFGPFSARAQQAQLEQAGVLATKGNLPFSLTVYTHAFMYTSGAFSAVLALFGAFVLLRDKKVGIPVKLAASALLAPLLFNIIALYFGHSVLFIQGLSGNTWFNVRYGTMMMPTIAIFVGLLVDRLTKLRVVLIGLILFVTAFSFLNYDAVTIDDARVGSSQKNVSEVSGWLKEHAAAKEGFILISAASHDAIIFSSGLPMRRFIHEGTGSYWESATTGPEHWARWIIMRTNDTNDLTFKAVSKTPGYALYDKVASYPFADVYELKPEYVPQLQTTPILSTQVF